MYLQCLELVEKNVQLITKHDAMHIAFITANYNKQKLGNTAASACHYFST